MTKDELIEKLSDLEWEDFEMKSAKAEVPKDVWETVSAFSNTSGGWLLFGVKQIGKKFEVQGVTNPEKIEQDFLNTIRGGKLNVFVPTRQEKHTIEGNTVLAFYVPASKKKPVYYNSLANTFIRRGSSDQRATREEIDSMYRDQTFGTKTSEVAKGTSRADINDASLSRYRDYMSRFNPSVSYNRYNESDFLQKLRIIEGEQCTLGGLLFLGNRDAIERFFPDFRIDLLEVPGTSYTDATVRYTFRLDEYDNLWEYYFECIARLRSKVDVKYTMGDEGFATDVSPGFDALREALVNMLMHCDHFSPACPRIRVFTNHIEFYNPGGMPKPIEELKGKDISLPRNPIITKLFRVVKLAENAGYGLDNMEFNWKAYNDTTPVFDVDFDSVIVSFMLAEKKFDSKIDKYSTFINALNEQLNQQPANIDTIIELLLSHEEILKTQLSSKDDSGMETNPRVNALGTLWELSGNSWGTLREQQGDKALIFLLLVVFNSAITVKEASQVIGVGERMIKKYIKKLKDGNYLNRVGGDFGGYWVLGVRS